MIVDLAAGTSEPLGVQFDGAIRLDAQRIALTSATYDYLGTGPNPVTLTDHVTAVYDQSEHARSGTSRRSSAIGAAVTVDGRSAAQLRWHERSVR